MRIRTSSVDRLKNLARRQDRSVGYIAERMIDEGLRMQEVPGIYFSDTPCGRCAFVSGTGLAVWEVVELWESFRGNRRQLLAAFPHLREAGLDAALAYHARYRVEVDGAIQENNKSYEELAREYPFIRRVTVKR